MAKKKAKVRKKVGKKVGKKAGKTAAKKAATKPLRKAAGRARKAARKPAAPKRRAPARSAATSKTHVAALPSEKQIAGGVLLGRVEDYFGHVNVMALKLLAPVAVGDMIRVKGHTTDITQRVESMQIEHQPVQAASVGDSVGIKISDRARRTDVVYKI